MATATETPVPATPIIAQVPAHDPLYRMSLKQYHQIAEAGILGPKDRVVLLDGVLVKKMTKGNPHVASTLLAMEALKMILPAGWHVRKEDPIVLPDGPAGHASVPEPDLSIVRGVIRDYAARTPQPADVGMLVEVAESSLRADREGLSRYAWAGIPIVWIVNLVSRAIEVSTDPSGPGPDPHYKTTVTYDGDAAVPVILDGREVGRILARDILP